MVKKNLFNAYSSETVENRWPPRVLGKELQSDGVNVMVVDESLTPFPEELTADAFSIKSLNAAGIAIRPTDAGKIPATVEQKMASAEKYGYDLNQRYEREVLSAEQQRMAQTEKQKNESLKTE